MFTCRKPKLQVSHISVSAQSEDISIYNLLNSALFKPMRVYFNLKVSNDTKYILNWRIICMT